MGEKALRGPVAGPSTTGRGLLTRVRGAAGLRGGGAGSWVPAGGWLCSVERLPGARRAVLGFSSAPRARRLRAGRCSAPPRLLRCPAVRAASSARLRGALPAAAPAPVARAARHRPAQAPPTLSAGGRRGSGCALASLSPGLPRCGVCVPSGGRAPRRSRVGGGEIGVSALTAEPCSGGPG